MEAPNPAFPRRRRPLLLLLLLLQLLLLGRQAVAREVLVPRGPLYRVEGTAVTVGCSVRGFEGPAQQDFEWFLYRPEAPDTALGVVSTRDPRFPYALFAARVAAGEVTVRRLRGDAAQLSIGRLRAQDAGVYECYTPSTDAAYLGSYSGKVELRVLPDLLQVSADPGPGPSWPRGRQSPAMPPPLTVPEGQELVLGCAAKAGGGLGPGPGVGAQHTHLSVSFGRTPPGEPVGPGPGEKVAGLQADLSVEAGPAYGARLAAGELQLGRASGGGYRLALGRARPADAGTYHCTAAQWIQDPGGGGNWTRIAEKRAVLAHVEVPALATQLSLTVGPGEKRLAAGEALELNCNLSAAQAPLPPGPNVALSVGWEMAPAGAPGPGHLVTQLDTDGVVSPGPGYSGRRGGLDKVAVGAYRLRLEAARPGDAGVYRCLARAYVREPGGRLRQAAEARSAPLPVHVREEGVVLEVVAWLAGGAVYRGEVAPLLCNVTTSGGPPGLRLALSWWAERPRARDDRLGPELEPARLVGGLDRDGVVELGVRPSGGAVSVERLGPRTHRLRLHELRPEDEGIYHCSAAAWAQLPDRSWYQAGTARSGPVTVYPYTRPLDTLFVPLLVGTAAALVTGGTVLGSITCCFLKRLRKR
ncbi:immunoglobulin superfamily member 8 [Tachyglossus aculeatus]|uniref:immunoglobulin superfamily member 8 n=1 Tax=Tachyglossus aculeatus TaxID=9261 RepID=UPI0018F7163C|nr:immunoglobulin superfamily member 8 [Tachyglossus aculeatus]